MYHFFADSFPTPIGLITWILDFLSHIIVIKGIRLNKKILMYIKQNIYPDFWAGIWSTCIPNFPKKSSIANKPRTFEVISVHDPWDYQSHCNFSLPDLTPNFCDLLDWLNLGFLKYSFSYCNKPTKVYPVIRQTIFLWNNLHVLKLPLLMSTDCFAGSPSR